MRKRNKGMKKRKNNLWKCPFCEKKYRSNGKGQHLRKHGYKINYHTSIGATSEKIEEMKKLGMYD